MATIGQTGPPIGSLLPSPLSSSSPSSTDIPLWLAQPSPIHPRQALPSVTKVTLRVLPIPSAAHTALAHGVCVMNTP